jgi:hypothetical protein
MSIVSDIEIRLRADIARLQQDMNAARSTVGGAMNSITNAVDGAMKHMKQLAGAIAVGAFVGFIKETLDAVDALTDLSTRTGITVEDLAGLAYGAKLSGTELAAAAASISKLSVNMGKESDRFAKLGVTATEPLEAFKQLSDIFKSIQDPQQRAAFGAEALGKSWQEAAVLLNEGSAGITTLVTRGQELSGITTQNSADAAQFNDALDELGAVAKGVSVRIAVDLLPVLKILTDEALNSSKAAEGAGDGFNILTETLKAVVVFGGNVFYVLKTIGEEIGGIAAQIVVASGAVANLLKLDFKSAARDFKIAFGEGGMGDQMKENADKSRQAIDEWSESVVNAGKAAKETPMGVEFPDPFGIDTKIAEENAARAEAFVKYADMQAAAKKQSDAAAAAAKKEQEAYRSLITTLSERLAAGKAEIAAGRELTEAEKARIKLDSELASGKLKLTKTHENQVRALMAEAEAQDRAANSAKKVREAVQALAEEQNTAYASLAAEVKGNKDALENYGLTKDAIELVTIARLEDRLARRGELDMSESYVAQLEREIALRKENAEVLGGLEVKAAQKKQAEDNLAVQTKMWDSIDNTAHEVFTSIFDSGKSAFDRLRDTLKSGLLDLLYQMTIKKWILSIGASVAGGASGLSAAGELAGVGGASGGGLGGIASLAQSAKTAYTIATKGLAGLTAGMGTSIVNLGTLFGSTAVEAFGAGLGSTGLVGAADAAGLYAASGGTGAAGAVTAGAYAGAAITAAAGIAAGVLGGKLISGQYGSNATVVGGTGVGAVAGAFMGGPIGAAIGGAIGGVIGGLANRAFGMGDKKYGETGITGTLSGNGFTGNEYAKWTQKGGWFRSDKADTDRTAVSATTSKAFVDTYAAIRQVSATLAGVIGVDTSALTHRAQALNINLTGLTTDADRLAAVTKFFEGVGDTIAAELVPNLAQFQVQGEALSTTLQRVSQNYAGVDAALQLIGRTSQEAFGSVGVSSIAAREALIKMAGGLDALSSGTAYFAENFLTIDQQMAPVVESVNKSLAALGMSGVKTTAQYADAVMKLTQSGALATESGQELYLQLLALAPAFKAVTEYNEKLNGSLEERIKLQDAIDKLTMTSEQLRAKERATIGAGNLALYDQLQALNDLAAARTSETDRLKAVAESTKAFAQSLNNALSSLSQGSLSTLTPLQKLADAQGRYQQTLAAAKAGDATAQGNLAATAQTFLTASQVVNASSARYAADAARVQAELAALAAAAVGKQTEAERQLTLLTAQADGILKVNESVNLATTSIVTAIDNLRATGYATPYSTVSMGNTPSTAPMGGPDNAALANALASVQQELAAMRAEAAQNAAHIADTVALSSASNAETITKGTKDAAMSQVYAEQLTPVVV